MLRYFENISYLVRMINEVLYDMIQFAIVLFVAILAFTDAFYSLDQTVANTEEDLPSSRLLEET